jgi:hypothetical protein
MEGKLFDGRICMECGSSGAVEEGEEDTRFFWENAD